MLNYTWPPKLYLIPITNSGRKTGFNGLIVCLRSLGELFDDVVKSNKLDTANQFKAAYKRLLIQ